MKKVFTHENKMIVENAKNLIEMEGMQTFLKNEFSSGAMGELSPMDTWPEVWVFDDADFDKASTIVKPLLENTSGPGWVCAHCSEENNSSFETCWNCQHELTGS